MKFVILTLLSHSYLYWPIVLLVSHQIKSTSIITFVNIPSFFASDTTGFMNFLKTYHVSGYLMNTVVTEALYDHYFSARNPTTVILHKLQHLLHFTHTSPICAETILQNCLFDKWRTYIRSILHAYYIFVPHFLNYNILHFLSLCHA